MIKGISPNHLRPCLLRRPLIIFKSVNKIATVFVVHKTEEMWYNNNNNNNNNILSFKTLHTCSKSI